MPRRQRRPEGVEIEMLSSSKARNPLDLNGSDFSALMKDIVPVLAEFLDHLPNAPFIQEGDRFELLKDPFMRPAPSEGGRPLRELLEIISRAADNDLNTASGSSLQAIPGSGLVSSAAADLIAGILNRYTGMSAAAPAMVAMEADVLRWMSNLLGMPPSATGILTSGGSMAVFSAIVCARSTKLPADFRQGVIYATDQTHPALVKALRLAGFPDDALQLVAVDGKLRMDLSALQAAIARDRAAGRIPFCISANAGTTNTGTIDPLPELAQIAHHEGLWYHVDAAYGGFFQLTARGRERLAGIEHADSVVLAPHKGLFVPFGTGCLLVRNEEALRLSHSGGDAPILRNIHELGGDDAHLPDFADLTPELTRPNRGLRLWLPLHLHGVAAFREALDHKLDLAQQVYDTLIEMPQLHVLDEPDLSVIAFHCRIPQGTQAEEDHATKEMVSYVNATRRVHLSTTIIQGRLIARIAILNLRTTVEILEEVVDAIRTFVSQLTASEPESVR
jgi:aromatic-L-amino-acid decarboxylase